MCYIRIKIIDPIKFSAFLFNIFAINFTSIWRCVIIYFQMKKNSTLSNIYQNDFLKKLLCKREKRQKINKTKMNACCGNRSLRARKIQKRFLNWKSPTSHLHDISIGEAEISDCSQEYLQEIHVIVLS